MISINPIRSRRAALTLAEVLIAMGILTVGLLGVASVFPVGAHYMQTGEIADRGAAIAQAALEDAIIQGHLNPENWTALHFDAGRVPFPPQNPSEPFTEGLREALADPTVPAPFTTIEQRLGVTYGAAYVIDPIGFAAAMDESDSGNPALYRLWPTIVGSQPISRYPATTSAPGDLGYRIDTLMAPSNPSWWPWSINDGFWPVRRVLTTRGLTLFNGADAGRSSEAAALFTASDDLAVSLPSNGDEPARQRIESVRLGTPQANPLGIASARQSQGHYSWLLTVAPSSDAARNSFATAPDAYPVDVSAAVFYKRQVGRGAEGVVEAERLVAAQVVSTSPGGGEVLMTRLGGPTASPFEALRGGHYVLVVGPHPQSTNTNPRLALRWCRVLNIQDTGQVNQPRDGVAVPLDRENQVLVSLRAPDWPWQPSNAANQATSISNDLRVAVVPGVVAVHTKTMRLGADQGLEWAID